MNSKFIVVSGQEQPQMRANATIRANMRLPLALFFFTIIVANNDFNIASSRATKPRT
jgi:hypothetical protein